MAVQSVQMIRSSSDTRVSIHLSKCYHLLRQQVHLSLSPWACCIVHRVYCRPLKWVRWIIPQKLPFLSA